MKLLHYSAKPFTFDRNHVYRESGCGKPCGFWLSVEGEDDWQEWCGSNDFGLGQHVYEVELTSAANVLHIPSSGALHNFNGYYGKPGFSPRLGDIDWDRVAADYDGIIIAPYQWVVRMESAFFWYYSWDCASGVIWNLGAVEAVREREMAAV